MNKQLILVKHSLPEIVENIPAREWHLSQEGRARADRLAEKLMAYEPEVLISSDEPKAIETAEILSRKLQLPHSVFENLHEHERSKAGYLTRNEFENAVREFFAKPDALAFGGETANQAHERFSTAIFSVLHTYPEKTIILVSHGTVVSLWVSRLIGTSPFELWKELGLPSFVVLDMDANTIVEKENII